MGGRKISLGRICFGGRWLRKYDTGIVEELRDVFRTMLIKKTLSGNCRRLHFNLN
jgi:hypothetical protein